jgi:hypothetical protein
MRRSGLRANERPKVQSPFIVIYASLPVLFVQAAADGNTDLEIQNRGLSQPSERCASPAARLRPR